MADMFYAGQSDYIAKLNLLAAPAGVQVNVDWNSISGVTQILNKPIISGSNTGDQTLASLGAQATLVSATNIKTINGTTLLGSGDLSIPTGTVTTASITTANGVSGTVATATTTPAITLTLGAITPASVAATGNVSGLNLSGTNTGNETAATIKTALGITTLSGSNTGDQTLSSLGAQAVLVSATNIKTINGTSLLGSGDIIVTGGGASSPASPIFLSLNFNGL